MHVVTRTERLPVIICVCVCVLEPYGESLKTVQTFKAIDLCSGDARFESVLVS